MAPGIKRRGFNGARTEADWSKILYWVGMLVLFMPPAVRLLLPHVPRRERLGLIIVLGMLLYLVKVLYSPLEFKFSDEFQHWRSTINILQSSHLFEMNFILPVSPHYPGLHNITTALIDLSGLSVFEAGIIVIGMSRLMLGVALFHFYERVSGSPYVAGIAAMLYMTNPHFQFLLAVFSYQAVAVGLMAFVLAAAAFWASSDKAHYHRFLVLLLLAIPLVTSTHHITTYAMLGFMAGWTVVSVVMKSLPTKLRPYVPWMPLALTVLLAVLWATEIAPMTFQYLAPNFERVAQGLNDVFRPDSHTQETFRPPTSPLIERLLNMASVGMIASALPLSVWFTWRRYRKDPLAMTLILGSLVYFGSIGLRVITIQGAELAGRSWPCVFVPVSFVLSVAIIEIPKAWPFFKMARILRLGAAVFVLFVFIGGIMGGWPPYWGRLPGPYRVGAQELSVEPEGITASAWAADHLTVHSRMLSDFTNHLLMGAYGNQNASYQSSEVFTSPILTLDNQAELHSLDVEYLVVDERLSKTLPTRGFYFNAYEPKAFQYDKPIDPGALTKFDAMNNVSRVFDSGNIIIYDVYEISKQTPVRAAEE